MSTTPPSPGAGTGMDAAARAPSMPDATGQANVAVVGAATSVGRVEMMALAMAMTGINNTDHVFTLRRVDTELKLRSMEQETIEHERRPSSAEPITPRQLSRSREMERRRKQLDRAGARAAALTNTPSPTTDEGESDQ